MMMWLHDDYMMWSDNDVILIDDVIAADKSFEVFSPKNNCKLI